MIKLKTLLEGVGNIWYHGSYSGDIKKFDTRRKKDKMGTYFADDKKTAEMMRGGMSYLYDVKINPKKIFDVSKYKSNTKSLPEFLDLLPVSDDGKRQYIYNTPAYLEPYNTLEHFDNRENLVSKLKKKGYDSIMFNERGGNTLVVFDPNIIKILKVEKLK